MGVGGKGVVCDAPRADDEAECEFRRSLKSIAPKGPGIARVDEVNGSLGRITCSLTVLPGPPPDVRALSLAPAEAG